MEVIGKKFQVGEAVRMKGEQHRARVLGYYSTAMVEIRIFDGLRHVGDACVTEWDLEPLVETR